MLFCSIFKILRKKGGIKFQLTEGALHNRLQGYTVSPGIYAIRRYVNT